CASSRRSRRPTGPESVSDKRSPGVATAWRFRSAATPRGDPACRLRTICGLARVSCASSRLGAAAARSGSKVELGRTPSTLLRREIPRRDFEELEAGSTHWPSRLELYRWGYSTTAIAPT